MLDMSNSCYQRGWGYGLGLGVQGLGLGVHY